MIGMLSCDDIAATCRVFRIVGAEWRQREAVARRMGKPAFQEFLRRAHAIYGVGSASIVGLGRPARVVRARHWVMYHAWFDGRDLSLPRIGAMMGGRDHSTVWNGVMAHALRHHLPFPPGARPERAYPVRYEGPEPTEANPWTPEMAVTGRREG